MRSSYDRRGLENLADHILRAAQADAFAGLDDRTFDIGGVLCHRGDDRVLLGIGQSALGFTSREQFLTDFLEPYFTAMDPNALLTMAWKWQRGDVSRHTDGDLAAALGRITAKTYVMPIDEDMFFPVRDCAAEQRLIPGSELRVIEDVHGHLGLFAVDPGFIPQIDRHLADLLDEPVEMAVDAGAAAPPR